MQIEKRDRTGFYNTRHDHFDDDEKKNLRDM